MKYRHTYVRCRSPRGVLGKVAHARIRLHTGKRRMRTYCGVDVLPTDIQFAVAPMHLAMCRSCMNVIHSSIIRGAY